MFVLSLRLSAGFGWMLSGCVYGVNMMTGGEILAKSLMRFCRTRILICREFESVYSGPNKKG